jgi:hypothetical protein
VYVRGHPFFRDRTAWRRQPEGAQANQRLGFLRAFSSKNCVNKVASPAAAFSVPSISIATKDPFPSKRDRLPAPTHKLFFVGLVCKLQALPFEPGALIFHRWRGDLAVAVLRPNPPSLQPGELLIWHLDVPVFGRFAILVAECRQSITHLTSSVFVSHTWCFWTFIASTTAMA